MAKWSDSAIDWLTAKILDLIWVWLLGVPAMSAVIAALSGAGRPWIWFGCGALAAFAWTGLVILFSLRRAKSKGASLVVNYAGYGLGGNSYQDVTVLLRGYIRNDRINVPVSNATFSSDPFPGAKKHLKVVYSYGEVREREIIRHEYDQLIIPEENIGTARFQKPETELSAETREDIDNQISQLTTAEKHAFLTIIDRGGLIEAHINSYCAAAGFHDIDPRIFSRTNFLSRDFEGKWSVKSELKSYVSRALKNSLTEKLE